MSRMFDIDRDVRPHAEFSRPRDAGAGTPRKNVHAPATEGYPRGMFTGVTVLAAALALTLPESAAAAPVPSSSSTPTTTTSAPVDSAADDEKPRLTVIPGLKISPEIGIGLGTMVVHTGSPRRGARMEYRVLYTTRNQMELRISNRTDDFLGTPWEARFEGSFQRFPDNYFGGGNNPADADKLEYSPTGGYGFMYFTRPIPVLPPAFRVVAGVRGEAWHITRIHKVDGTPGAEALLGPHVTGHDGGIADVWETGVEYDTRDSRDVPVNGLHASQRFGTALAGDFAFQTSESWLAAYRTLSPRFEVAGKLWQKTMFGDPPFFLEPNLGNEDVLRGVPNKRFRDRSAQAAQAEVRFNFPLALPIIASWLGKDWQLAAFGETGRVGSSFTEASRADQHYSGGVGGRLIFNGRSGVMRGDLGFSEHGVALIVKFNQAF